MGTYMFSCPTIHACVCLSIFVCCLYTLCVQLIAFLCVGRQFKNNITSYKCTPGQRRIAAIPGFKILPRRSRSHNFCLTNHAAILHKLKHDIFPVKALSSTEKDWFFSCFFWKHMSWVLIRSASLMFSWRNKKNIIWILPSYLELWHMKWNKSNKFQLFIVLGIYLWVQ